MKIIVVPVNEIPRSIEIDGSLESMQAVVGGLIQLYPLDNTDAVVIICNEEGKSTEVSLTELLSELMGELKM